MPHLIIEFARDLAEDDQVSDLLDTVHKAAKDTGLFIESHIKIRAVPVQFYRTGVTRDPFIHAQLRIKSGRSAQQKKALSEAILESILSLAWPARVITIEVVDMDSASYSKHTN